MLDIFRARGGRNHRLSWHGSGAAAQTDGVVLVKQSSGTFAGADVPFAKLDGPSAGFLRASGFSYLYDVARSPGPVRAPYAVDWRVEDKRGRVRQGADPHLRLHALTPCEEVALASGDSPRKFMVLRYLIQSRLGDDMHSQFVNVLEPYGTTPFIKHVRQLGIEHDGDGCSVAAVAVELTDGRTDILISCEEPRAVEVEGGIDFNGTFGMIRLVEGEPVLMRLVGGTLLACRGVSVSAERDAYRGQVTGVDASAAADNRVSLDPPLPEGAGLPGKTIHFVNDLPIDSSYKIRAVTPGGVSSGDITIVRGLKDRSDVAAGYTYVVNPGDGYVVPTATGWNVAGGEQQEER